MADLEITSMLQSINIRSPPTAVSPTSSQPTANTRPIPTIAYSWREKHPKAQLLYIRDHREANRALDHLDGSVYGLDLEWKPNFVKGRTENPVALVQIADSKSILLLQITAMQEFPSKLYEFLLNPNIVKAGVGIQGDAKKLYHDWRADIRNCADLALLARTVHNDKWKGRYTDPLGLAHLVAVYEDRALEKGKITRSNWERLLTEPQQNYAANDAHSGYVIYMRLINMISSVSPTPEPKYYSFDAIRGQLRLPSGISWQAVNPNYDPGPPPPPRLPKPLRQPKPENHATPHPGHDQYFAPAVQRVDYAPLLPIPQATLIPHNVPNNRGRGVFRGNFYPHQHWQPHLSQRPPPQRPPRYGGDQSWQPRTRTVNRPETRSFRSYDRQGAEEAGPSSTGVSNQAWGESGRGNNSS